MLELYFFRNISDYNELWEKTQNAYKRNSLNKRKVKIVKTIFLEEKVMKQYSEKIKWDNEFVINNIGLMKIKNGVWNCIELRTQDMGIVIMADGYPYARFVALRM